MYAIIECGGKQYRVQEGDRLQVELIKAEVGSKVTLDQVLLLGGEKTVIGTPVVVGAAVSCKVLGHDKEKKVLVYHYKAKKNIRKRYGHRQPFTSLLVESILPSGYVKPVGETITVKPAATVTTVATEGVEPVKAKAPAAKAPAKKKEEAAASEEKPVKKTTAKKAEIETAATAEEKPARKPRAKKTETPEA